MEILSLTLVSISAIGHAYWNFLLKKMIDKSENKLLIFWLCMFVSCTLYFPFFIFSFIKNPPSSSVLYYPILYGFFLALYLLFLTKSYSYHDLSLAYPLSKTIPLFTLLLGIFVLGEHISTKALIGILCIVLGAYSIHFEKFSLKNLIKPVISLKNKGSMFALFTAIISAFYGLVSKIALKEISPFIMVYLGYFFSLLFYSSIFLFNKRLIIDIKNQFKMFKKSIIAVGCLDLFGYFLISFALVTSKLSYIFALRQISIIFAVFFGTKFLNEGFSKIRIISASIILVGAILVGLS